MFAFHIITWLWNSGGCWNSQPSKTRLFGTLHIVNIMADAELATQGAMASVTMV